MLIIEVEGTESWDSVNEEFIQTSKPKTVKLEHSLLSLSRWEQQTERPFIPANNGVDDDERTQDDYKLYVKCMVIGYISDETLDALWSNHIDEIQAYIEAPSTATVIIRNKKSKPNRQRVTSELIYYWMIHYNIPTEYEKWHLNRLLTLIDICNIYQDPKKNKMSMIEAAKKRDQLNKARKELNRG